MRLKLSFNVMFNIVAPPMVITKNTKARRHFARAKAPLMSAPKHNKKIPEPRKVIVCIDDVNRGADP